ncbi:MULTISPECIES: SPOR domain-containing protein [Shewanella]|uniref:Cell division protein FtsN n=1 Tax=Shewanella fodinae TaxID=552357 RepID=A0A4R2FD88_9GAMM|nr:MULTISPECIES: SPOR domain-containing protein [Shewanella]MBO1270610.1 SPOR domain-containing protein [Shewanella sp. 4t3-1-2LB]TCN86274.1 cell division protein FtsN [Shewanella fodinae]
MRSDYANSKPRRQQRGNLKKPQPPKRPPLLLFLMVLVVVAGFGYFLWTLKNGSPAPVTQEPVKVVIPEKTSPKKDPNALPPKPKEEWTYQQELENKQVEVDLPEKSNQPTRPYQMQCGSFRKESQAQEMKAVIAFQGLEAQVRKIDGNSGVWYKVVLGPYQSKRKAETDRHELQRAGLNGCMIWFWES